MRKSEQYRMAMAAVLEHPEIRTQHKLEILETLMADKRVAEYSEEGAEKNAALS